MTTTTRATMYFESGLGGLAFEQINLIECGMKDHKPYQSAPVKSVPFVKYKKKGGRKVISMIRPSGDMVVVEGWDAPITKGSKEYHDNLAVQALRSGCDVFTNEINPTTTTIDSDLSEVRKCQIIFDSFA